MYEAKRLIILHLTPLFNINIYVKKNNIGKIQRLGVTLKCTFKNKNFSFIFIYYIINNIMIYSFLYIKK